VNITTSPLAGISSYRSVFGGEGFLPEDSFIAPGSFVLSDAMFTQKRQINQAKKYLKAGPRKEIFFKPAEVRAAIVTCGGLCPGLNVVIRELVMCLWYNYGVKHIYGIKYGFKGFYSHEWEPLTPKVVVDIHHLGGTILGSSRGGFDSEKIIQAMKDNQINQVYVVGGDGTHRGIDVLYREIARQQLAISVCGIPKTIDNDIPIIDKSFGFETSVEEAQRAIRSAHVESRAHERGVGLVKLMGRSAGFLAMHATIASRDPNICLIPEFPFDLQGTRGLYDYVYQRLKMRGRITMVVAEGAGILMRKQCLIL
jgi:6-phosphofructokinase 1